jgi:hypothetical protein
LHGYPRVIYNFKDEERKLDNRADVFFWIKVENPSLPKPDKL